ncbi:hypothetical protein E1H99_05645 [Enterococcus hirae]|nr:hypothetical protein E1H99_05645 [Enterococcus hirae]
MPLKSKMSKKGRIPQASSRETIGKANNKHNDKNHSGNDQAQLNYIANNIGQTLTPDGLLTFDGVLFLSNIFYNVRFVDPPEQQTVIKKNSPAFEANTRIDVRREGNQTRIHSFVSTSTINRRRIQLPLFLNRTYTWPHSSSSVALPFVYASSLFDNQTFYHQTSTTTQSAIDIAKRAHELSLSVHQKVHALYQLMNCTTMRRTDQVNTLVFTGESVEQTSFKTICQDAVGQAETQNNQGMKKESELSSPHDMTHTSVQGPPQFSAEEAAQRLSKTFKASFENKYNATIDSSNHVHNQVTETFWNNLTKLFYQFFYQHENTFSTQEQNGASSSLLSYFADWLLSSFSVNYGEQIPNHPQSEKKMQLPMPTHTTDPSLPTKNSQKKSRNEKQENKDQKFHLEKVLESVSQTTSALSIKEESILPQIWHLLEDFYGRVDGFLQRFNFDMFSHLGAEAAVLPATVSDELFLHSSKELSTETVEKIKQIMKAYLDHKPFNATNTVPFPSFWYDHETFELRSKIQVVNQKVKDYLCGQGVPCDGLSGVELLEAVEKWEEKDGLETKMSRRRRLASVIRKALGLQNIDLKYTKATYILFQWRNNNIFQGYTFEGQQQPTSKESQQTTLEESVTTKATTVNTQPSATTSTTPLPSEINAPKLEYSEVLSRETQEKLEKVVQTYIHGYSVVKLLRETIPPNLAPFWYDLEVFLKREQLENVNKELKAFLCMKNQWCQDMTEQALFLKIRSWIESKEAQTTRTRRKKIAGIILTASGLQTRKLTNSEAKVIILQWRDNNIFKSYKFKEIAPMRTETTVSLNDPQSNQTIELPVEASSVKEQLEMVPLSTTQSSNTSVKLSDDATKLHSIITAFFDGKPSPVPISEKLPLFMDDEEVYKKRNETDHVNDKVKEFLCKQNEPCAGLSPLQLINTIYRWIWKEGQEKKITRSKEVVDIILTSSGLTGQEVSDDRASAIIQQWRNNNIFKEYQFKESQQIRTETTGSLNENQPNVTTPVIRLKKVEEANISQSSTIAVLNESQSSPTTELPHETDSVSPLVKKSESSTAQNPNTYEKMYTDFMEKINSIVTAFLEGKPSPVPNSEKLPAHWYDGALEVYEKRNETQHVNDKVKEFLCKQNEPCDGLSSLQLINAIEGWIRKEGKEIEKTRSKEIAKLILTSLGLASQTVSGFQANAIFLQWRNNNIFKDYTFGPIQFSGAVDITNSELMETTSETRLHSYGVLPSEIAKTVNKMHGDYFDEQPLTLPIYEPLVPFWYDFELYQKRNETVKANEAVNQFLSEQENLSEDLTYQPMVIVVHEWVRDGQTDAEILARQEQLAPIILEGYGIRRNLTATEAVDVVLQWENNNIFKDYTFIELKQASLTREESDTINSKMKTVPDTFVDPDLSLVRKIVLEIVNNVNPLTIPKESLPIFYYDYDLFQSRNETENVNKKLKELFVKEGIEIKDLSFNELEKGMIQWIEKGSTDKPEREQFLAYFLMKAYGVEDFRFGEFLSVIKTQAIFKQWKVNTVLVGRTYKEITHETIHYLLFKTEDPSMIRIKEQKKESNQIFADFIYDRTMTISKDQPIHMVYYDRELFKLREKTPEVNEAVRKFLLEQKVSLKGQSASELVREIQGWIFEGTTYATILEREKQIAQLLQKAYGLEEKEVEVKEARYLLLQWENNNAQADYTYRDISQLDEIEISKVEENEERREKIEAFTRENKAFSPTGARKSMEENLPEWIEEKQQKIRKKIVALLFARDIEADASKPNELVEITANWATLKVGDEMVINAPKVKMLANIILGRKEGSRISLGLAKSTFIKWLYNTVEDEISTLTSTELSKEETTQVTQETETISVHPSVSEKQKFTYEAPNWRNFNLMVQVAQLFRQEGVLKGETTKENILIAMGKWLTEERGEMILSYEKIQSLSKVILKELNLYGGGEGEKISEKDTKLTITTWVFENVLGSSMEGYMLKKILNSPNPSQFTIGNLRKLFETEALINFSSFVISKEELTIIQKLWFLLLKEALPNYFLETSTLADELLISNYASLMQLTGAKLLEDEGIRTQFNQTDIQTVGAFFWEKISRYGVTRIEELRYLLLPAILATAQLDTDVLRKALEEGMHQEVALQTFIGYWRNSYFQLKENRDILYILFKAYQEKVLAWRRKQALAEVVAQKCLDAGEKLFTAYALQQDYLATGTSPCPKSYTAPDLEKNYTQLTKAVSDSFYPLDQKLIEFALKAFDSAEKQFIFSIDTQLYEASVKLEHIIPGSTGGPIQVFVSSKLYTTIKLDQTDLFVAIKGNEKRWYALKKLEEEGGYFFYRVDTDPLLYLKYGLLDRKDIWSRGYKKEGKRIKIGNRYFDFTTNIDQNKKLPQGEKMQPLIDAFSQKHSDKLYDDLYKAGDDKSISQQVLDVLKHFIPFYDCVTGIIDKDITTAATSCVIDIVLLIPVLGQVTSLSSRFAFGMAKAIATGGIRNAVRQGIKFTPKLYEIKSLLKNIVRYFDPGIETVVDGSKFVINSLVDLRKELWVADRVKKILERVASLVKVDLSLPKDVSIVRLPNGLGAPVKQGKDEFYRLVTDLKTSDVYGYPFWVRGDRLEMLPDPVLFTEEQKALIKRLEKGINPDQIFAVEPNLNPNAYGSGKVMSVAEKGKETKYFITMDSHTVPVRVTPIEENGIRYDVVDGEKIIPVNFNGKEWYFEASTSPLVTKELAEKVTKRIDEFESLKDPTTLSPPYERDLMNSEEGRTYIKVDNVYIPLILFDRNRMRYHLVKKDVDAPMVILRFDPDNGGFRMESVKEKEELKISIQEEIIQQKGKAQSKWKSGSSTGKDTSAGSSQDSPSTMHEASGTSQGSPSTSQGAPSTSKGAIPKVPRQPVDFRIIDLPEPPGNEESWKKLYKTEILPDWIRSKGDADIDLTKISRFPPKVSRRPKLDEDFIRKDIYKMIAYNFSPPIPKLEVVVGLDSAEIPNSLKPFFKQLRDDFKKAEVIFKGAVRLFKSTWKMESIASTEEGKYLIEMLKLHGVPEIKKEAILRQSIKKLFSTAKHGQRFLEKSKDLLFQNVWTLSSKLSYDKNAQKYYSSFQKFIKTEAFTVKYDGECRIFIFADAFHLDPKFFPGEEVQPTGYETVMHEVTHIVSGATDLLKYGLVRRGLRKNGKRTLDYYDKEYPNMTKEDSKQMQSYRDYLAKVLKSPNLTVGMIIEALEVNHTLRVHFQLTDAEMLMTILRDVVEGRAFDDIFRMKRENNNEQSEAEKIKEDDKSKGSFETYNEQLGTGDLFMLHALMHSSEFINFEREFQQSRTQEQTTDLPDLTSAETSSNRPTNENRNKREVASTAIDFTESTANQSLSKLINQSIERSNQPNLSVSDQPVSTELLKSVSKRSALNLVATNTEKQPNYFVSEQQVDASFQKNASNQSSLNLVTTNIENNPSHFVSDSKISTGLPKDTAQKSFLDVVFTSRNRSTQINPTKGFNQLISKSQKEPILQH